jgi:hypothetical protein
MRLVIVKVEGRESRTADEIDADGTIYTNASGAERITCGERAYTKKIKKAVGL